MSWADAPRRGERGFSLVESVIAVAVLGIIASAMVGGMATSIATSDIHRQQSVANTVMVSAAETVKNAPYLGCAPGYSTAAVLPTGWITEVVRYWNPQTSLWDDSPSCHDTTNGGDGLGGPFPMQKVTILATDPGHRASTSVDIVKRGP